jgi:hypothetical protein
VNRKWIKPRCDDDGCSGLLNRIHQYIIIIINVNYFITHGVSLLAALSLVIISVPFNIVLISACAITGKVLEYKKTIQKRNQLFL